MPNVNNVNSTSGTNTPPSSDTSTESFTGSNMQDQIKNLQAERGSNLNITMGTGTNKTVLAKAQGAPAGEYRLELSAAKESSSSNSASGVETTPEASTPAPSTPHKAAKPRRHRSAPQKKPGLTLKSLWDKTIGKALRHIF